MKLVEVKDWSDERLITQNTPDRNGFNAMITEELGEALEATMNSDEYGFVDAICDITVFGIGEIYKYGKNAAELIGQGDIKDWIGKYTNTLDLEYIEAITYLQYKFLDTDDVDERVSWISEMIVISYDELIARGFDPDMCMDEVMKEINSRTGAYSEKTKKWQKDKSEAAQEKWYKADFTTCHMWHITLPIHSTYTFQDVT